MMKIQVCLVTSSLFLHFYQTLMMLSIYFFVCSEFYDGTAILFCDYLSAEVQGKIRAEFGDILQLPLALGRPLLLVLTNPSHSVSYLTVKNHLKLRHASTSFYYQ